VMGVTQAAGLSLRWFRDMLGDNCATKNDDAYTRMTAGAAKIPPGADGLLWAPYLMGERTPHLDSEARAVLAGLTASHTQAHIVRAILEGVAFSLKDTFTIFAEMNVPVKSIRLGGGGARSPLWRQIQADVFAHDVEIVEAEEGAAYGAAILAGVGVQMWSSVQAACDSVVRVAQRVAPVPASVSVMSAAYEQYRKLYPAMKSVFQAEPPDQRKSVNAQ
jgi:xylulokinase